MSWYYRLSLIFITLFIVGCAKHQPEIGKKVVANEDELIIKAILAENDNHINDAIKILQKLYKETDKYVYYEEIIKIKFFEKKYKEVIQETNKFIKKYPNYKLKVVKYQILSYLKLKKIDTALKIAKKTLKENRSIEMYKIISYIYITQKKYKKAIIYLKSAYAINHSPQILAEMGDIFFKYLKNPNEAISYYQTHIRLYGCEELICNRLADIYSSLYDYDNLLAIYKKLFYSTNEETYARKIIFLYIEQKKYKKAIKFIKENRLSNNLLIAVNEEAFKVTQNPKYVYNLYKLTNNNEYFFLYSITKFEKSKKGLVNIKNLENNLYFLINKDRNPKYLNYLGYILIDYDINPKKGLELVKEAVEKVPNEEAFLDSLAWGYYKLHNCKKAYEIIENIKSNDKEILKHKKLIRRCYEYFRKNHRKTQRKFKKR
jgi:tetratricopeptide (TPR) repeat protein